MIRFATHWVGFVFAVSTVSTLSAQVVDKVDGSSRAAFVKSVDALVAASEQEERAVVREAIDLMLLFLPPTDGAVKRFDGLTLEQFVAVSRRVIALADLDHDGKVDVVERAKMRKSLQDAEKRANEAAVRMALKIIASAQAQMQLAGVVDVDADGIGEYAYFGEMTALSTVRDRSGPTDLRVSPAVLSTGFAVDGRRVRRNGYYFQIWLPGRDAVAVPEAKTGGVDPSAMPDADGAECQFVCYAWPVKRGVTGDRAFMIDAAGDGAGQRERGAEVLGHGEGAEPVRRAAQGLGAGPRRVRRRPGVQRPRPLERRELRAPGAIEHPRVL